MKLNNDPHHLNGIGLVTGQAKFIGDEHTPAEMLYVKCLASPHAHAKIVKLNIDKAKAFPGVAAVLTWQDVPGVNQIGHMQQDQPLLPTDEVVHVGQVVAIVVAKTTKIAVHAVKLIEVEYSQLPAIFSIDEALQQQAVYVLPRKIERGDVDAAFAKADYVLEDEIAIGGQEHVYLETNRSWAIPGDDNNITIFASTQNTAETQHLVANVLGLKSKDVTVDVKRLGGGFGYKEVGSIYWSCLAAVAAYKTKKPVEIKLTRQEDMMWSGKRHPFLGKYKLGLNKQGKIVAYDVFLASNGGFFTDISIPIFERAMFHATHAYFIPNVRIVGVACRTNLPPNTAFRGFGAPQGIFVIEDAIEKIATKFKLDALAIRETNAYRDGEPTPYGQPVREPCYELLFNKIKEKSQYDVLRRETDTFNHNNKYIKRGLALLPLKFGISFTFTPLNQATALIWIYSDGSISMSHGGIEMGQEINTKVAQIVAHELGVTLDRIRVESSNTQRNGNASPTAASTGSDINGHAALNAAQQIKARLCEVAANLLNTRLSLSAGPACYGNTAVCSEAQVEVDSLIFAENTVFDPMYPETKLSFAEVVQHAYMQRVNLGAQGFYKTPHVFFDGAKMQGSPFLYFVSGVVVVQVEVDILTGANKLLKVYILHETGKSINKSIDLGQLAGAFFQGFGYVTMEELMHSQGKYLTSNLSTYKIPTIRDLPEVFEIELMERELKHTSVMGSKAIGEPPLVYGLACYFAIRNALQSINPDKMVKLAVPATSEAILQVVQAVMP